MKIGIIGCGNLGMSLLTGIAEVVPIAEIHASKRSLEGLDADVLSKARFTTNNEELIAASDVLILALKPFMVLDFLEKHGHCFEANRHTLVSVATGIRMEEMTSK